MILWANTHLLIFNLVFILKAAALDFLNNELAKICHPIDNSLDLLFILDGSGGSRSTFDSQLTALTKVVEMVDIGENSTQIAVMQYGTYTYMEFLFNAYRDKASMFSAIKNIRYKSGTTKTGKALDKAFDVYNDEKSGARRGRHDIAPVVIIVSDGHSKDDPVSAANRLRQIGMRVLVLGIGTHINFDELVSIAGTSEFVFQNLTDENSFQRFIDTFEKFTMGEQCEFARGKNGADIKCNADSVSISVSTAKTFHGHLFIEGQFTDPKCVARTNTSEITLKVGLLECGIKQQFSINPKGFIFETNVLLQYHPNYSTAIDKESYFGAAVRVPSESVPSRSGDPEMANLECSTSVASIRTPNQKMRRKSTGNWFNPKDESMPCKYTINRKDPLSCKVPNNNVTVFDDRLSHKWECNLDNFDTYQSFLIRNCFVVDVSRNVSRMIIDENGCSLEPELISTPEYDESLSAFSEGLVMHHPDVPLLKIKCSLKFCDRLMSECDAILPPKCGNEHEINKRQAGFPVSIRSLNGKNSEIKSSESLKRTPKLIKFKRRKSGKKNGLKKKKFVPSVNLNAKEANQIADKSIIILNNSDKKIVLSDKQVNHSINSTLNPEKLSSVSKAVPRTFGGTDVKLNTQNVHVVSTSSEEKSNSSENRFILNPIRDRIEDPFQESINCCTTKFNDEAGIKSVSKELDEKVIKQMSISEFQIESNTIMISNSNESCMKKIKS